MNTFKRYLRISLCLWLSIGQLKGQDVSSIISGGDAYFEVEDYFKASNYYLKALEREPNNLAAKYKLAESYRLITNYEAAENYYADVLHRTESRYPLARYYYGLTQKFNGKYQESLDNFELFLKNVEANRYRRLQGSALITFTEQARIELEGCMMALDELEKTQPSHNFHLLGEPVNSIYNDYAAYTYHHDSTIVITSARAGTLGSHFDHRFGENLTDLFRYRFKNGQWLEIISDDRFDKEINTNYHDGSGVFNQDYTKFYFTHCAPNTGCEIFFSTLVDNRWAEPKPLNTNINRKGSDSMHPALTVSGDTLFFASDRPGGLGGFDIWMSVATGPVSWGPAVNLGDYVNTTFREISPFYDVNGHTLFLASDGHVGHGGLDIFMAENIFGDSIEVFNMGIPYNSSRDDAFFMLGALGGFLSSNRKGGQGNFDIYTFQMETDTQIIAEIIESQLSAGRNSIFVTDYNFDNPDIKLIEAVVSHLIASRLHNTKMPFSISEQKFYEKLSEADKIRIERIINSRMKSTNLVSIQAIRFEDEFFYQQIAGEFKYYVDRMVTFYLEEFDFTQAVAIPHEEKQFYEDLNSTSQNSIDRYIALKLSEYENLDLSDEYYSALDNSAKNNIDVISKKYLRSKSNLKSLILDENELNFLQELSAEERARTELSIANQVASLSYNPDYNINQDDKEFFLSLSDNGKSSLDNLAQAYIEATVNTIEDYLNPDDLNFYQKLTPEQQVTFDRLLAKRIQNFIKADKYVLEAIQAGELSDVIDFQLNDIVDIEYLSDSVFADNSTLKLLANEDRRRFARLLASAANLIMLKAPSGIKSTAIHMTRQDSIINLLTRANPDYPEEYSRIVGDILPSDVQRKFNLIIINRLFELAQHSDNDSVSLEKLREYLSPEYIKTVIGDHKQLSLLSEEQLVELSSLLISSSHQMLKVYGADFRRIVANQKIDLDVLSELKRAPEIIASIDKSVVDEDPDSSDAQDESNISGQTPVQTNSLNPSDNPRSIEQIISSTKRKFSGHLSNEDLETYLTLRPNEKRFVDLAVQYNLIRYIQGVHPVLSIGKVSPEEQKDLLTVLSNDLKLENFRRDPVLRRYLLLIEKKSPEELTAFNTMLLNVNQLIITANTDEFNSIVQKVVSENAQSAAQRDNLSENVDTNEVSNEPETPPGETSLTRDISRFITSSKPLLSQELDASQLQGYVKIPLPDKVVLDQYINSIITRYVNSNDPVLELGTGLNATEYSRLRSRLISDLQLDGLQSEFTKQIQSIQENSTFDPDDFTALLAQIVQTVITQYSSSLRGLANDQSPTSDTSVTDELSDAGNLNLSSHQLDVYNAMSEPEKELFRQLLKTFSPFDGSNGNPSLENDPQNDKNVDKKIVDHSFTLEDGLVDGEVITIQVIESDGTSNTPNLEKNVKRIDSTSFKVGETLRLIWSEKEQMWYEVDITPK